MSKTRHGMRTKTIVKKGGQICTFVLYQNLRKLLKNRAPGHAGRHVGHAPLSKHFFDNYLAGPLSSKSQFKPFFDISLLLLGFILVWCPGSTNLSMSVPHYLCLVGPLYGSPLRVFCFPPSVGFFF